jgi:hypothetical protein
VGEKWGLGKMTLGCNRPARHFPLFPFYSRYQEEWQSVALCQQPHRSSAIIAENGPREQIRAFLAAVENAGRDPVAMNAIIFGIFHRQCKTG